MSCAFGAANEIGPSSKPCEAYLPHPLGSLCLHCNTFSLTADVLTSCASTTFIVRTFANVLFQWGICVVKIVPETGIYIDRKATPRLLTSASRIYHCCVGVLHLSK